MEFFLINFFFFFFETYSPLIYTLIWDFLNKEDTNQPRSEEGVAKTNTGSQMREINKKELSKNINIYKYNQEQFD